MKTLGEIFIYNEIYAFLSQLTVQKTTAPEKHQRVVGLGLRPEIN